ncbi:MAG TPA: hypothetical protein PLN85_01640 [archaeon]|nr:hypothetical protein [archaeon]HRS53244.1 hypothetical protein [Bacteroidales bacterium]
MLVKVVVERKNYNPVFAGRVWVNNEIVDLDEFKNIEEIKKKAKSKGVSFIDIETKKTNNKKTE